MRFLFSLLLSFVFFGTHADDGYRLWLKYDPIKNPALKAGYCKKLNSVFVQKTDETITVAVAELKYATRGMLGKEILETKTPASTLKLEVSKLTDINPEAFEIKTIKNQIV